MPKIVIYRPNRSKRRVYTYRDAARIACRVTRRTPGVTFEVIEAEYRRVCPSKAPLRRQGNQAQQTMQQAADVLGDNAANWLAAYEYFRLVNVLLQGIALVSLIVPMARPARVAAQVLSIQTARMQTTAFRLTRDSAIQGSALRRDAANDAFFRQVVGL